MEWEKGSGISTAKANSNIHINCHRSGGGEAAAEERRREGEEGMEEGVLFVKVMTDEQMEVLRRQIAVYATICEQLVEMHKAVAAEQDSLAGLRLGGLYADSLMVPGGHKIAARQRWTPTNMQLQILENMFDQGHGTPSKQKIKEITLELLQHGQISETNVYNWFQNRRARSKRKQTAALPSSNTDSEVEAEDESPKEKKTKTQESPHDNLPLGFDDRSVCDSKMNAELQFSDPELHQAQGMYQSNDSSRSSGNSGHMPYFEDVLANQRVDPFIGSIGTPGSFSPFQLGESYDIIDHYNN